MLVVFAAVYQIGCSKPSPTTSNNPTPVAPPAASPITTVEAAEPVAVAERAAKPPCAADLAHCPNVGCGGEIDPNLNKRKNLASDPHQPQTKTLEFMAGLGKPDATFKKGDTREKIAALGEGKMIKVLAYLLVAKPELGGESCNCGLHLPEETDNHLVLVTKATVDSIPLGSSPDVFHAREKLSQTAEFTPRVRLSHHNFTREKVQPMIDAVPQKALLVRVTGLLLFDSEHFFANHLNRANDWETHPVFKLEFCTTGDTCKVDSNAGWKSLDDLP